ncbi:MAG TPA: LysR family transcriptional regulator [Phycisphaerales bacterium]|nr:LysR family transcriptional regulator [Phycisphaerales bacterium]
MELTPLRYFRAIAQHGHMTRAARAMGVTQPALSAMLRKLEGEVGAELLHRTGRGVELTEAGRVFLSHAEDALRGAEAGVRAVRELVGLERGSIRVGGGATATTYLLPPVVSAVRKKHPGLRFYVREAGSTAVAAAVMSGELDLGIVTLPGGGGLRKGEEEMVTIPLVEDELRLIVPTTDSPPRTPRALRRAGRKRSDQASPNSPSVFSVFSVVESGFRWKDLVGVPVVAFEAGTAVRGIVDAAAMRAGVSLSVVMELRSIESIKGMVEAGIGVGFVSRFALEDGEGLVCTDGGLARRLAIVRRRDRVPSAAVAEFEKTLTTETQRH